MRLTKWEKRWLVALLEGFAPTGSTQDEDLLTPAPNEADHVESFVRLNQHGSLLAQVGLRGAVAMLALSPVWTGKRFATFDRLSSEERVALLEELTAHRTSLVREFTWLMKVQASMSFFGVPSIRARSGYDRGRQQGMPVKLRVRRPTNNQEVA